jgi:hypothetical protein
MPENEYKKGLDGPHRRSFFLIIITILTPNNNHSSHSPHHPLQASTMQFSLATVAVLASAVSFQLHLICLAVS